MPSPCELFHEGQSTHASKWKGREKAIRKLYALPSEAMLLSYVCLVSALQQLGLPTL